MRILAMILCALAACTLNWSGPAHSAVKAAPAEQRLAHISIVKKGSGPPVVFIPGLASPRASWDGVTSAVAKDHSLYLVQVNGFGGDDPGANLSPGVLEGIVADLSDYVTARKLGRVSLVGHSMGGLASLMFAREHPSQVDRVMVVDALPYFPVLLARGGPMPTPEQVNAVAQMMRDKVAARYGKPVDAATVKADVEGLAVKPESRVRMSEWAAQADPRVTAELLYEDMSTDLRPALPAIKASITVVVPWTETPFGKDKTLAFYQQQYGRAPDVNYVPIAESGHFVMLDQPEAFAAALADFVK